MNTIKWMIFGADSIRAFQDGRKSQTRRARGMEKVNENPDAFLKIEQHLGYDKELNPRIWKVFRASDGAWCHEVVCPYAVGDYLYSKEKHILDPRYRTVTYWADTPDDKRTNFFYLPWRPAIFQYRADARFWFRISDIRAQRLWDISYEDCIAEGITIKNIKHYQHVYTYTEGKYLEEADAAMFFYSCLWDRINPKLLSSSNPWLFAYSLEKCEEVRS